VNTHYKDFIGHEEFMWKLKEDLDHMKTQMTLMETELNESQVNRDTSMYGSGR
jgi:hypothetical protein